MEKSFDFGALLVTNQNNRKSKPTTFVGVAEAFQKRRENIIKHRKSNRLTTFDSTRNIPRPESPAPITKAKDKIQHRRQQLEKWKLEKEQKKKELAALKKKPFITGIAKAHINYTLPPPLAKPSTSGRVTRSQTKASSVKTKPKVSPVKHSHGGRNNQSFAPKNAIFKPPELKNPVKLSTLAPPSKSKNRKASTITFEPVIPHKQMIGSYSKMQTETRSMRGKSASCQTLPRKQAKKVMQSSGIESNKQSSCSRRIKTPAAKKSNKIPKTFSPKILCMASSSESSDNSITEISKQKSLRMSGNSLEDSQTSSDKLSSDELSSAEEQAIAQTTPKKSLPKDFRPSSPSTSDADRQSDVEFVSSPVIEFTRKPLPSTPGNRIPKSESSSEERLRSPKSPIDLTVTPEQMEQSPHVTLSRGKNNARKEMKWKIEEGLLDNDVSDIDSVNHFRKQLSSEIKRMTEMCETWEKIAEQTALPEVAMEAVLSAVGNARLLMSQKLQQFAALVERCGRPEPRAALVTPADLHGFWDMVFMQIEDVDLRFKKLEDLRLRNWTEGKPASETEIPAARPAVQNIYKPTAASKIKDLIAAARKAKKEQGNPMSQLPAADKKTFDAGFFCVQSPVRSPVRSTTSTPASKPNLLKAVLSSEAKKTSKNSTSFAMLRASLMAKNTEYNGFAPLPQTPEMNPVNLFATPGRSILKPSNAESAKSTKKSIKVVIFNASDSDDTDDSVILPANKNSDMYQSALDEDIAQANFGKNTAQINAMKKNKRSLRNMSIGDHKTAEEDLAQPESDKNPMDVAVQDNENTLTPNGHVVMTRRQHKSLLNLIQEGENKVRTPRTLSAKKKIEREDGQEIQGQASNINAMDVSFQDKENTPSPGCHIIRTRRQRLQNLIQADAQNQAVEKDIGTPRTSSAKKKVEIEDVDETQSQGDELEVKTPRSVGKKKVKDVDQSINNVGEKIKSSRKKALQDSSQLANILEETIPTPRRSSRFVKV